MLMLLLLLLGEYQSRLLSLHLCIQLGLGLTNRSIIDTGAMRSVGILLLLLLLWLLLLLLLLLLG